MVVLCYLEFRKKYTTLCFADIYEKNCTVLYKYTGWLCTTTVEGNKNV